jgi:hypothetical protein
VLITSRPEKADDDRIVLVATTGQIAERLHDTITRAYPRAHVTTRTGRVTGVVSAPAKSIAAIELLVASIEQPASEQPASEQPASDSDEALTILAVIAESGWSPEDRGDVLALLGEIEEEILRAIVEIALLGD